MTSAVLLDTSFFIRFLNEEDPLYQNADKFFQYFISKDIAMVISTIAIAEYCVRGDISELPLKNLQILPFNLDHAKSTGRFAQIVFEQKGNLNNLQRNIIPNDTKLFAQADAEKHVQYYLSSDASSKSIYSLINNNIKLKFQFLDLNIPYSEVFGILDLI